MLGHDANFLEVRLLHWLAKTLGLRPGLMLPMALMMVAFSALGWIVLERVRTA